MPKPIEPRVPDTGGADSKSRDVMRAAVERQLGEMPDRKCTPPSIPDHNLLHRVGSGAYGEVWLARNALGTLRAVKIVYRVRFKEDRPYEREFNGIVRYEPVSRTHEGLVQVLHVGRNDQAQCFYYVMELADVVDRNPKSESRNPNETRNAKTEGAVVAVDVRDSECSFPSALGFRTSDFYQPRTLRSDLARRGRLSPADAAQLALRLAGALGHLHAHGLVHRDIKPSNVIFV